MFIWEGDLREQGREHRKRENLYKNALSSWPPLRATEARSFEELMKNISGHISGEQKDKTVILQLIGPSLRGGPEVVLV